MNVAAKRARNAPFDRSEIALKWYRSLQGLRKVVWRVEAASVRGFVSSSAARRAAMVFPARLLPPDWCLLERVWPMANSVEYRRCVPIGLLELQSHLGIIKESSEWGCFRGIAMGCVVVELGRVSVRVCGQQCDSAAFRFQSGDGDVRNSVSRR